MYKFYLETTMLPVAPSDITIKCQNKNEIVNLLNEGELNVLKKAGLREYSFKALIPAKEYNFTYYPAGFISPMYYLAQFETLRQSGAGFDFTIINTQGQNHINERVSLEHYNAIELSDGDYYVDFILKQYKYFSTKVVEIDDELLGGGGSEEGTPQPPPTTTPQITYTIVTGDNLISIARRFYGNDAMWETIYWANKTLLDNVAYSRGYPMGTGYRWIFPGTTIILP